jgi:hypothetical protein
LTEADLNEVFASASQSSSLEEICTQILTSLPAYYREPLDCFLLICTPLQRVRIIQNRQQAELQLLEVLDEMGYAKNPKKKWEKNRKSIGMDVSICGFSTLSSLRETEARKKAEEEDAKRDPSYTQIVNLLQEDIPEWALVIRQLIQSPLWAALPSRIGILTPSAQEEVWNGVRSSYDDEWCPEEWLEDYQQQWMNLAAYQTAALTRVLSFPDMPMDAALLHYEAHEDIWIFRALFRKAQTNVQFADSLLAAKNAHLKTGDVCTDIALRRLQSHADSLKQKAMQAKEAGWYQESKTEATTEILSQEAKTETTTEIRSQQEAKTEATTEIRSQEAKTEATTEIRSKFQHDEGLKRWPTNRLPKTVQCATSAWDSDHDKWRTNIPNVENRKPLYTALPVKLSFCVFFLSFLCLGISVWETYSQFGTL